MKPTFLAMLTLIQVLIISFVLYTNATPVSSNELPHPVPQLVPSRVAPLIETIKQIASSGDELIKHDHHNNQLIQQVQQQVQQKPQSPIVPLAAAVEPVQIKNVISPVQEQQLQAKALEGAAMKSGENALESVKIIKPIETVKQQEKQVESSLDAKKVIVPAAVSLNEPEKTNSPVVKGKPESQLIDKMQGQDLNAKSSHDPTKDDHSKVSSNEEKKVEKIDDELTSKKDSPIRIPEVQIPVVSNPTLKSHIIETIKAPISENINQFQKLETPNQFIAPLLSSPKVESISQKFSEEFKSPVAESASKTLGTLVKPSSASPVIEQFVKHIPETVHSSIIPASVDTSEHLNKVILPLDAAKATIINSPIKVVELTKYPSSIESKSLLSTTKLEDLVKKAEPVANHVKEPVVKGGQGPLHLLAATLCKYQPDRLIADEQINNLYVQRAVLRKSLFEFMSLKFTNLEKLSSKLNPGLEVMPPKKPSEINGDTIVPTHGWPVVGKCTAYDLRLMAEAAWCECADTANCDSIPKSKPQPKQIGSESVEKTRKQRSVEVPSSFMNEESNKSPHSPVIVPKLFESIANGQADNQQIGQAQSYPGLWSIDQRSLSNLNLTQRELSAIQEQAGLTQECKRNSLRLSKALFNHLAEDQSKVSESWPKLYAQLQEDECARKRLIDIVSALSGYRTESSSIRRDNVEFAFAMDDLRSKVLETDVGAPLTFDRHFIEVEQFLQQSVKLMLANIDPERAKLTSMRYRSLMPAPFSADDQCVQLHQLLLAKNHPQECNPNQYGQLPDVLRMTANSLALWSIESELAKLVALKNLPDFQPVATLSTDKDECIANLVSS